MDESALLDLLECPVCLERLDATAKVLPCQHTFCRRCLLGIVGSRGELRCPECRTLVESGVDELPNNILLVRLLDGIKQRPRRTGSMHGTCTNGSAVAGVRAQGTGGGQRDPGPTGGQSQRVQAKSTPVRVSLIHQTENGQVQLISVTEKCIDGFLLAWWLYWWRTFLVRRLAPKSWHDMKGRIISDLIGCLGNLRCFFSFALCHLYHFG